MNGIIGKGLCPRQGVDISKYLRQASLEHLMDLQTRLVTLRGLSTEITISRTIDHYLLRLY